MRRSFAWVVAMGLVAICSGQAHAGRTFFGWLYGTEVMPERGVELQTWVLEKDDVGDAHERESSIWWGPLIGVTDQLELAIPLELEWLEGEGEGTTFTFRRYGLEARYRFVTQDPEHAPAFAPLLRVAVKRDVVVRDVVQAEADFVGSYTSGAVQLLVDLGAVAAIGKNDTNIELRPGAGISIRAKGDLRVGGEAYGELGVKSGSEKWFAVGPNFAWTHGRFWLSGAALVGISNITLAPRFMFGIAF